MSQNTPQKWFSLEESFFKNVDQQLLAKLRSEMEIAENAQQIMQISGIQDEGLATEIAQLHITVETLAAFRLVPLISVAWADDRIEENERYSIIKSAKMSGITPDEPAGQLMEAWTKRRPPKDLFETWCEYTKALCASLTEAHRDVLKAEIMSQVTTVAEANGGVLRFGSVSESERQVIKKIEEALC